MPPYPHPTSPAASAALRGSRKRDTRPELRLRSLLHRRGMRFRVDRLVTAGDIRVRPDILFSAARVAVFIDGCFWHQCPEHGNVPRRNQAYWVPKLRRNVERDKLVTSALMDQGWCVIRIWEHTDPDVAASTVASAISGRTNQTFGHLVRR